MVTRQDKKWEESGYSHLLKSMAPAPPQMQRDLEDEIIQLAAAGAPARTPFRDMFSDGSRHPLTFALMAAAVTATIGFVIWRNTGASKDLYKTEERLTQIEPFGETLALLSGSSYDDDELYLNNDLEIILGKF